MQDVFSVIKMAGIWEFVAQTSTKSERIARFSPSRWPYMEVVDRRCENASKTFQTTLVWLGRQDEKIETPPYLPAPAPTQPTGKKCCHLRDNLAGIPIGRGIPIYSLVKSLSTDDNYDVKSWSGSAHLRLRQYFVELHFVIVSVEHLPDLPIYGYS